MPTDRPFFLVMIKNDKIRMPYQAFLMHWFFSRLRNVFFPWCTEIEIAGNYRKNNQLTASNRLLNERTPELMQTK